MTKKMPKIILSEQDYLKLSTLVARSTSPALQPLEEELARAQVVPSGNLPGHVVSIHSAVRVRDLGSGAVQELELVLPHEADASAGRVSVLAPLGIALIGLRAGDEYRWQMPNGRIRPFVVLATRARELADSIA